MNGNGTAPTIWNNISSKFKALWSLAGKIREKYKKQLSKKTNIIFAACVLILLCVSMVLIVYNSSWSIRLNSPLELVKYQKYSDQKSNFTFKFPEIYVFDADEKKKYGDQYLAGFHLISDSRTGCDVRLNNVGINLKKSDKEISDAIYADLSKSVNGLSDFAHKRIKIGNQPAIKTEFSLIDPLGETLHISQVMVSNANVNYLLVCGSGQVENKFLNKDFQDFFDSFDWIK